MIRKTSTALLAVVVTFLALTALAASEFEGTWTVKDGKDKPFDITLSAEGKATRNHPQQMAGTWKEEAGAAIIKWDNGATMKIMKEGDHYMKQSLKKDGTAGKISEAQKKQ